ncbi:MAG: stage III sporulation protein AF [Defluviitaleaceae bacterium]|nr:stage III sporulation protein AF [Defluviitaleaceae bacterium]
MSAISEYIRNLAVFLIFASFVNIINPGKKFEQYINLVLGIILIFVLIAPLSGIINALAGSSGDIFADISLAYDRAALARQIEQADQAGQQQILNLYRDGLTDQARRLVENHGEFYLETANFTINSSQENFGEILQIHLILRETDSSQPFIRIDPVRIEPVIGSRGEPPAESSSPENPHIISLKNLLAGFYNLPTDNIILEVRP